MSSKLFRNSLIASAVTVSGIVISANHAIAIDSDPIEFTGNIAQVCTFGTPTPGTLVQLPDEIALSSQGIDATSGTITLSCNIGIVVRVQFLEVNSNGMNRREPSGLSVQVSGATDSIGIFEDGNNMNFLQRTEAFSDNLTVDMTIRFSEPILNPGTYIYRIVLMATPS